MRVCCTKVSADSLIPSSMSASSSACKAWTCICSPNVARESLPSIIDVMSMMSGPYVILCVHVHTFYSLSSCGAGDRSPAHCSRPVRKVLVFFPFQRTNKGVETGVVSKGLLGDVVACAPARKAYTKGETIAKGMNLSNQQEPEQCFKLVAIDGQGRYVSIFDGVTEYKIGETMTQEVRAGHKGGIYVCESMLDLLKLGPLPSRSVMMEAPWAVVEMVGWGPKMKYNEVWGGSKVAITHIVPVKFVEFPHNAKIRFLQRSRRQHATAQRQREHGRQRGEPAPLALTPEELQTIFRDWQVLLAAFDEA